MNFGKKLSAIDLNNVVIVGKQEMVKMNHFIFVDIFGFLIFKHKTEVLVRTK